MITPTTIGELTMFATVQIRSFGPDGKESSGTGFFYSHAAETPGMEYLFLVTNKHVVEGGMTGFMQLHAGSGDTPMKRMIDVTMNDFDKLWVMHPDPEIDICILNFSTFYNNLRQEGKPIFMRSIPSSLVPSQEQLEELFALQSVAMFGYPLGLIDTVNNLPIARRGTTATHPAIDFEGKPLGIIDIAVFGGSSGSPILVLDEGMYATKTAMKMGSSRAILLGIQFAGARATEAGTLVVEPIPTDTKITPVINVFAHLAYYVKARELQKFVLQEIARSAQAALPET